MKVAENTLLLLFVYSCFLIAKSSSSSCPSSSCGVIRNISHPFRLKGDPSHCGYPQAELVCENNVTFLYLNSGSQKYFVKSINCTTIIEDTIIRPTIRLVDASIKINDTCSFPTISVYYSNFSTISAASPYDYYRIPVPINLMSCPQPLNTSVFPYFTDASHCQSSDSRFRYVRIGIMKVSEVPQTCRVDVIVMTSWEFKDVNNVPLQEIHRALLYGFELEFCTLCYTPWTLWDRIKSFVSGARLLFLIPVAFVVLISAGVSFPAMIIVGLTCGLVLFIPSKGMYKFGLSFHREWAYMDYNSSYLFTVIHGASYIYGRNFSKHCNPCAAVALDNIEGYSVSA